MHDYNKVPFRPHHLPEVREIKIVKLTKEQMKRHTIGDIVGPFIVGSLPGGELCFIMNNLKRYY